MADFIIPKGREFVFTVTIMQKDSFLTQDVEFFDPNNSDVQFRKLADMTCVTAGTVTMEKVADPVTYDENGNPNPTSYKSGRIKVTVDSARTADMDVGERGSKVDGYYLRPMYEGIITVAFTESSSGADDASPTRTVLLENIYVIPATC